MVKDYGPDGGVVLTSAHAERGKKVIEVMADRLRPKGVSEELSNLLKGLPSVIHMNGLGQVVAIMQVKSQESANENEKEVLKILDKLLGVGNGELLDKIRSSEMEEYLILQDEALDYVGWMKEFAQAFEDTDGGDR